MGYIYDAIAFLFFRNSGNAFAMVAHASAGMSDKELRDTSEYLKALAELRESQAVCGVKHGLGDQTCCREKGHEGPCRCKAESCRNSTTWSEWYSEDGKFKRHKSYETRYHKMDEVPA